MSVKGKCLNARLLNSRTVLLLLHVQRVPKKLDRNLTAYWR